MTQPEVQDTRSDLNDLIQQIQTASPVPGGAHKKRLSYIEHKAQLHTRSKQRWAFGVALALIVVGLAAIPLQSARAKPVAVPQVVVPVEPPLPKEEVEKIHVTSRIIESKFVRPETCPKVAEVKPDHAAERRKVLKKLEVDGRAPRFYSPSELKLPADGKPIHCYCLLFEPLDEYTSQLWNDAKMLSDENEITSQYLRYVVISNEDALRLVNRPCVHLVADTLEVKTE